MTRRSREAMAVMRERFIAAVATTPSRRDRRRTRLLAGFTYGLQIARGQLRPDRLSDVVAQALLAGRVLLPLLNNQPMGFYAPEVLIGDARRHGIEIRR
jgi:hypothetical protein